jgi:hypothetical protein
VLVGPVVVELAACWLLGSCCDSVVLGLGQIAGLQVLADFLELSLNLLKLIQSTLRYGSSKRITAGYTRNGHSSPPILEFCDFGLLTAASAQVVVSSA